MHRIVAFLRILPSDRFKKFKLLGETFPMISKHPYRISIFAFIIFCLFGGFHSVSAQKFDSIERGRMKDMLKNVKNAIKKNYYDPTFHGIDLDTRFQKAEERIKEVKSSGEAFGVIAQAVIDFNDSHLMFSPPSTGLLVEYGWRMRMIGDKCFIVNVRPGSDAEKKGVKVGDQLLMIDGFNVNRKDLWKMSYYYNAISKRMGVKLTLVSPGASSAHELEVKSEIKRQPQQISFNSFFRLFDDFADERNDYTRYVSSGSIVAFKFPSFAIDPKDFDIMLEKPKKASVIIMDLRGNPGGYVKTMELLAAQMFDHNVHIADLKGLKPMEPQKAETVGENAFKGKLIVLIDSESGSAAEIFARLVQIEKRGVVLGDVSAGAVMQSKFQQFEAGTDSVYVYGVSVTNADVIMSDGKSLEHVGVMPDELILPTAEDLAAGRDPVMVRAFELAGGKIDPVEAGKFFPYYWKGED